MSDYKEIVCLANSYKLHGRCIAGKEVRGGIIQKWIRPVSARPGAELSLQEYQIGNGYEPDILDILRIPMEQPAPRFHQQENILIDPTKPWQKIGEYPKQNVTALLDFPRQLWPNKMSTKDGVNNCIFEKIAHRQTYSMRLIQPQWFKVEIAVGKDQPRAYWGEFHYCGITYKLKITDPKAVQKLRNMDYGEYDWPRSYLTISLTELFQDRRCHKLIAAIIEPNGH